MIGHMEVRHSLVYYELLILVICNFSVTNITIDEVDQALVSEVVEVSVVNIK